MCCGRHYDGHVQLHRYTTENCRYRVQLTWAQIESREIDSIILMTLESSFFLFALMFSYGFYVTLYSGVVSPLATFIVAVHVPPRGFVISFFCKQLRQCFTLSITSIPACFRLHPFISDIAQGGWVVPVTPL